MEQAQQLVDALVVAMGIDEDEEPLEYLIDHIAEAGALIVAALAVLLEAANDDERTLL